MADPTPPKPAPITLSTAAIAGICVVLGFVLGAGVIGGAWYLVNHLGPGPTPPAPTPDIVVPFQIQGRSDFPLIAEIPVSVAKGVSEVDIRQISGAMLYRIEVGGQYIVVGNGPGTFGLEVEAISSGKIVRAPCMVTLGPPVPVPPGPGPVPPVPPPAPAPIPAPGLRVLVVFEAAKFSSYPAAQANAINSEDWRDYVKKNGAADPDGSSGWRCWDVATDVKNDLKLWQDAFARPRKSVPWLIISNGVTGYEGEFPANLDDLMALIQKYKPAKAK